MFANSITVIILSLLVGLPPLIFMAWGLRTGQFENLDETSESIFEEEELRYLRPWEKPAQVSERARTYGALLPASREGWKKWL
ncbi:MAG TPA: cbb3-type cytochrome oxidase assembly protein CcoS [Methylophilaceae bacterium]|nr:cbb3-type cytochrome oxidase assembly protein CcoS [Methylophilaceae bacterium]